MYTTLKLPKGEINELTSNSTAIYCFSYHLHKTWRSLLLVSPTYTSVNIINPFHAASIFTFLEIKNIQ